MNKPLDTKLTPPRFVDGKPLIVAGLHGRFSAKTAANIPALWQRLEGALAGLAVVGRTRYGLVLGMASDGDEFEYVASAEVDEPARVPAALKCVRVPARRYAVFAHDGHVSTVRSTLGKVHEWLPASGFTVAPHSADQPDFFERYGEGFDPRTGTGDIEVWIPIAG